MNVLHVSSEVAPFSKTGGLGDVAAALPRALGSLGERTAVVTPRYRIDPDRFSLARRLRRIDIYLGAHRFDVVVFEGRIGGARGEVPVWFIDHPLFDRAQLYTENGADYPDNALRFALLSRAAREVARAFAFPVDIIHAHDWQAALALYWAEAGESPATRPKTVLTIHNLAFLGLFPKETAIDIGLSETLLDPEGIEFYGQMSFLKAGIQFADRITTVSPRYAREIQTPELGCGLDGLLRIKSSRLVGILNGADYDMWNPARDPALAEPYSIDRLDGKTSCKAALQHALGLPDRPRTPLCGAVSRLTDQKGFDLVATALEHLLDERDLQVVILGTGDRAIEERLLALMARHPAKLAVQLGYDETLAHRIYGGADLFLMPSRYEPCGLGQIYALRYGAVPIVRATGGLDDTVIDYDVRSRSGTGFKFTAFSWEALATAWRRALTAYAGDENWPPLVKRAMSQDFSWAASARSYQALYRSLLAS